MNFSKSVLLALVVSMATTGPVAAQEISELLSLVTGSYANEYVQPFTSAFGADYNTGLFHTADNGPRKGFRMYIGVKVFATIISDSDKQFNTTFTEDVDFERTILGETIRFTGPFRFTVKDAPTIFGDPDKKGVMTLEALEGASVTVNGEPVLDAIGNSYSVQTIEGLIDLPAMPAAAPHIEVGTFLGTDVMFRYVPPISISSDEVGRFGLRGAGIRHSISQYFPSLPFHLAAQGVVQELFFDDTNDKSVIKLNTWAVNVQASKKFGILTVYGGLQAEDSNVKVNYSFEQSTLGEIAGLEPLEINIDLDGANTIRAIFGIGLAAGPVQISTDFNLGSVQSASFGLGVSF